MELPKKLAKPAALGNCMSHNTILSLGTGARNCSLALGRPGYQAVTIVDAIPRGGATRVRIASPISIRIGCQSSRGCGLEVKTKIQSTLKVAKDPLNESKIRLARSMHVKAYLLNSVLNIRASVREILKSTGNIAVLSSIRNKFTFCVRKFSLSINVCRAGVTPGHASAL
jgi:hypothetical protein